MRNFSLLCLALLAFSFSYSQVPQAVNYQAVARDAFGNPYTNKNISVRITINEGLPDAPESINSEPYTAGWFFKLQPATASDVDALMDATQYQAVIGE